MKSIEQVITELLVNSGMDKKDEKTQVLAAELNDLFIAGWDRTELGSRIHEITLALKQRNKMLYGDKITDDIANRNLIDPNIMQLRLQGLRKKLKGEKK